jgi:P2 family phage contractile tail tube protein
MGNAPNTVKQWNMYIDGEGLAGKVKDLTLPVLEMTTESMRAGTMLAPVDLDMGLETLTMSATLMEFNRMVLKKWGVTDLSGLKMRFLMAEVASDGNGVTALEVSVRGRFKKLDFGTLEAGKPNEMKMEGSLTYYKLTASGETIHEIDVLSGKQLIGGIDRTKDLLAAIGL